MQKIIGSISNRSLIEGYIETMDLNEGDIKRLDTVEYDGKKYNVDDIVFMDSNQQKEVSKRVELKTIIKLGAEV
jgi:hypothetical protein